MRRRRGRFKSRRGFKRRGRKRRGKGFKRSSTSGIRVGYRM